jgi:hypothetical protein
VVAGLWAIGDLVILQARENDFSGWPDHVRRGRLQRSGRVARRAGLGAVPGGDDRSASPAGPVASRHTALIWASILGLYVMRCGSATGYLYRFDLYTIGHHFVPWSNVAPAVLGVIACAIPPHEA